MQEQYTIVTAATTRREVGRTCDQKDVEVEESSAAGMGDAIIMSMPMRSTFLVLYRSRILPTDMENMKPVAPIGRK